MALTAGRWIALALALSVVSASLILRTNEAGPPAPRNVRGELWNARWETSIAARRAASRLRARQIGDSVTRSLNLSRAQGSALLIDKRIPPSFADRLRALAAREGKGRPSNPARNVAIVFLLDAADSVRGIPQTRYGMAADFILPATDDAPCLVLVRVQPAVVRGELGRVWLDRAIRADTARASLLGPCGFYEWFGAPGDGVGGWLARGGWEFGLASGWQQEAPPWFAPDWIYFATSGDGWPLRYFIGLEGFRCATGDADECRQRVLLEKPAQLPRFAHQVSARGVSNVDVLRTYSEAQHGEALGPRQQVFLADMARELGPERFRQFWRSSLPPEQAFEQASGRELGAWTSEWARRTYGPFSRGPGMSASAALIGLAIAAAALALASLAWRRRQVA